MLFSPGVSVERVANLGFGGGEMGCHLLISSSMQPAFSQAFLRMVDHAQGKKRALGFISSSRGREDAQSCAGCVEGRKGD